jgi:glyoxylase-like metal-dependent hydrolase (beta-lactamase superfamily II)
LDGGAMFGVVPKALWSKLVPADERNRISMAMRSLVVKGRGKTILVDVGAGTGYGEKFDRIYAFENGEAFIASLETMGIAPGDVTDIVISHLHFDHAGGVAAPAGNGWQILFPKAVHHIQKVQWEHALKPNPRDQASYFKDRIEILEKKGVLRLHEGDWTLYPGIDILICNGHTPGLQLVKIHGGGKTLLYCADLIPTSAHLPTPYIMAYDLDPVRAMEEKVALLEKAHEERWVLFFEHDPSIAACHVEKDGNRFVPGEIVDL